MKIVVKPFAGAAILLLLAACATQNKPVSLYTEMGGQPAIEAIVDNFINEIGHDQVIVEYFASTSIDRFREKMIEQLCVESGGPCRYTGDTMIEVHTGMNITESDFNRTVDLLINAMNTADIAQPLQNRLLARLAPMRSDMIYR